MIWTLLRRAVGKEPALFTYRDRSDAAGNPTSALTGIGLVDVSDNGLCHVVGESFHQRALRTAARSRTAGTDKGSHLPATALLVPETANPHDATAVRVDVTTPNGAVTVGHLPRSRAAAYHSELLALRRKKGLVARCPARITGGGPLKKYGIYLHLADPGALRGPNRLTADERFAEVTPTEIRLRAEARYSVTGEEDHQDVLVHYAARYPGPDYYSAEASDPDPAQLGLFVLGFCTAAKGKYAGERRIEVRIGPHRVGEMSKQATFTYAELVQEAQQRGATPVASGFIERRPHSGYHVELYMPARRVIVDTDSHGLFEPED